MRYDEASMPWDTAVRAAELGPESGHPAAYMRPLDQTTALNYVVGWSGTLGERLAVPLVQLLVRLGATVDRDDGGVYEKYTPLHAAVTIGSASLVELLLGLGANPNARTSEGQCALHLLITIDPAERGWTDETIAARPAMLDEQASRAARTSRCATRTPTTRRSTSPCARRGSRASTSSSRSTRTPSLRRTPRRTRRATSRSPRSSTSSN